MRILERSKQHQCPLQQPCCTDCVLPQLQKRTVQVTQETTCTGSYHHLIEYLSFYEVCQEFAEVHTSAHNNLKKKKKKKRE